MRVLRARFFLSTLLVLLLAFPPSAFAAVAEIVNLSSWTHPVGTWGSSTNPGFQWQERYDWEPSPVASVPAPVTRSVVLTSNAAYVASGLGLQILDVSDPAAPAVLGTWVGSPASDVAVMASATHILSYVAADTGLFIVDVTDASQPMLVGSAAIPLGRSVAVSGSTAYVVDSSGTLVVVDASVPASPGIMHAFPLGASSVTVSGSSLYVVSPTSLHVFDISDPINPVTGGSAALVDGTGVTAVGTTAYVADGSAGLKVVDCSNLDDPQVVGAIDTPGDATGVALSAGTAYIADGSAGLQLVNVSVPTQPTMAGTCDTPDVASGVAVWGTTVCVADGSSLQVLDAPRPTGLDLVGEYHTSPWYNALDIAFIGDVACIPAAGDGVKFVDVSTPSAPTPIATLDTPGSAIGIDTVGTTAYVGDGANGLVVMDVSSSSAPRILGTCAAAATARDVDVEGTTAFVAAGGDGVHAVDVSDPDNPTLINTFAFTSGQRFVRDVLVQDSVAYIADYGYLHVVDVSDPAAPVLLDTIGSIYGSEISIDGDRLYVAAWSTGINVFDVSDPANTTLVGRYTPGSDVYHATGLGTMMLVGRMTYLELVDMYDPAHPRVVASRHIGDYTDKVAVRGGLAYLAAGLPGLQIFDLGFDAAFSHDLTGAPATPDTVADGPRAVAGYSGVADGEWYFNVRAAVGRGPWGAARSVLARVDGSAPSGTVRIDGGVDYTTDTTVMLELTASDTHSGVAAMRVSNDGTFDSEPWEPFSVSKPWTLSSGDGVKTVYVQFEDVAGNVSSAATDSIILDTTPPVLAADEFVATEDETLTVPAPGVLGNDTDLHGTVTSATVVTPPDGDLALHADGSFVYRGRPDFNGTDTFTYRASDGRLWSDPATVTITVTPVNDAPVAVGDAYSVEEGDTLEVAAPGVLGNDTDVEDDPLTAVLGADASHGHLALAEDGSFAYTPEDGFIGTDTFTYAATDGDKTSEIATVTIAVTERPVVDAEEAAGADRYATAVEVSKQAFPGGADAVVIATGQNWPDAISGTALAGVMEVPILLVKTSTVPAAVLAEIDRLGATKAIIVGGQAAVADSVNTTLEGAGLTVTRISGDDRYQTADAVALETIELMKASTEGYDGTAFVSTGAAYADAVAAAPLAAAKGWPLFFSRSNGMRQSTLSAMTDVTKVLVLGGDVAVSADTYTQLQGEFDTVERLWGASRYATAVEIAAYGVDHAGLGWNRVGIATGESYPDALAGGVLQGKMGGVMLLTRSMSLRSETRDALIDNQDDIRCVTFFGGPSAVGQAVRDEVVQILQ